MMKRVAILAACRSAIGNFGGSLSQIKATELGVRLIKHALAQQKIAAGQVDELILGNVLSAGLGQNIARQTALAAGLPVTSTAFTVNKVCGSGLKSVILGAQSILTGDSDLVITGGLELMSQAPYLDKSSRFGAKMGHQTLEDSLLLDGLWDAMEGVHMGMTAENIAERYQLTRQDLDRFALASQEKALTAQEKGLFAEEIVPVPVHTKTGQFLFSRDEYPRRTSLEQLSQLKPAFKTEGLSTAGNSSGINDGAAVLILSSEDKAAELELEPLAYIEGWAAAGVEPSLMGLGPIPAVRKVLAKLNLRIDDIDLFEINEAFAAQTLAVMQDLKLSPDKVNPAGGAIALGHPIGASGARILTTLIHQLKNQQGKLGLASLCIGGGQGISLVISSL